MSADWVRQAKVGDRVVCINPCGTIYGYGDEGKPQVGSIYTIRAIDAFDKGLGIRVEEIVNPIRRYTNACAECSFAVRLFRPVQPRNTDISWATDMLKATSKPLEVV